MQTVLLCLVSALLIVVGVCDAIEERKDKRTIAKLRMELLDARQPRDGKGRFAKR